MNDSNEPPGGVPMDVAQVASLARLRLDPEFAAVLQRQLADIIDHVNRLREVDVSGVEPTSHARPFSGALRPDEARLCLDRDTALAHAPSVRGGLVIVPKILE